LRDYNLYRCRVCGFNHIDILPWSPWGEDGTEPSYDMCACCFVQFGYEDCDLEDIVLYRKDWLSSGAEFKESKYKPKHWNLAEQLQAIPKQFLPHDWNLNEALQLVSSAQDRFNSDS